MAIPDYETMMLPLLRIGAAAKGNEIPLIDASVSIESTYEIKKIDSDFFEETS
ncbi:hypothetical protein SBDP1_60063 [Syntrophobacter sp. SbD1]|nr:hypothetical protein SBDP1_60063 [Syntrophobacter sp. SbD1]